MHNFQVGDLLVASSLVEGTILHQSVCLLVYEDSENTIGLMLNRPMQALGINSSAAKGDSPKSSSRLGSVNQAKSPDSSESPDPAEFSGAAITIGIAASDAQSGEAATQLLTGSPLHFGGPLAGPLVAVHGASQFAEAEAGQGIFVAAQRDNLEALMQQPKHPFRLIVGHLGWTQDQLENEIDSGVWHRMPANADVLMTDDSKLWPSLIREATGRSIARWVGAPDIYGTAELN